MFLGPEAHTELTFSHKSRYDKKIIIFIDF